MMMKKDNKCESDVRKNGKGGNTGNRNRKNGGGKKDKHRYENDIPVTNDFSWYNKYPELTESVARLPFAKRPGMSMGLTDMCVLNWENGVYTPPTENITYTNNPTVPTVMAMYWVPSIGISKDNQSPASIAARELYGKVRSAFSGTLDENAPDLLMYVMALDSIFAYIAWMKRVYRTLNSFSPNNKGVPYAILTAEGFSNSQMENLFENRVKIWGQINSLIYNVSKFTCPDVMDIFKRHYWMSSNVYTDTQSGKSQLYLFIPEGFYKFNDTGTKGTQLDYVPNTFAGTNPFESIYKQALGMIAALSESDDAYTMNGHLARAFEGTKSFQVALLREDERLDFVYDPVVLLQITNATCFYGAAVSDMGSITQEPNTNAVLQQIAYTMPGAKTQPNQLLLNVMSDSPGVADVVEATRLMSIWDKSTGFLESGTEFIARMGVIKHNANSSTWTEYAFQTIINWQDGSKRREIFDLLTILSTFNCHPTVYIYHDAKDVGGVLLNPICQMVNATPIELETLTDLHEVCVYSEFNSFDIR